MITQFKRRKEFQKMMHEAQAKAYISHIWGPYFSLRHLIIGILYFQLIEKVMQLRQSDTDQREKEKGERTREEQGKIRGKEKEKLASCLYSFNAQDINAQD